MRWRDWRKTCKNIKIICRLEFCYICGEYTGSVFDLINSYDSYQSDAAALVQEDKFGGLSQALQDFIKRYSQGQTELKDLVSNESLQIQSSIGATNETTRIEIRTEHRNTRSHIKTIQEDLAARTHLENQRRQFLESLRDKDMNARKNQIENSHFATFSTVFDENEAQWKSFRDWLRSDDSLYWISGKAGSGKSTFVNFLFKNEKTKAQLDKWGTDCAIVAHFIWSSGTASQRSIRSLLRSLLYQILEGSEVILDVLLQKKVQASRFRNPDDWSKDDLEETISQVLSLNERGTCIFVDGLDEIDPEEGPFDLLHLMKSFSLCTNTKICVSSRPEPIFKADLERFPKLKLQDLTRPDMEAYTKQFLKTKCSINFENETGRELVDEVVRKADGVFLWVSLALKSLQRGMVNGDNPEKLMERLQKLPSGLRKLYEEMLKRIGDDQDLYRKEAAVYFNMFMTLTEGCETYPNLFHFAVAVDPTLRTMLLDPNDPPSLTTLKKHLLAVDHRLASLCAGLLETSCWLESGKDVSEIPSSDKRRPWETLEIVLVHKSARDFLLSKENRIPDLVETTRVERMVRALQAIALEDMYPREEHITGTNWAFCFLKNSPIEIPDEQVSGIFQLTKDIYHRNGWPDIYEVSASYGLDQCFEALSLGRFANTRALQNYLFICLNPAYRRIKTLLAPHLEMGADPNTVEIRWANTVAGRYIGWPTPVLWKKLNSFRRATREEIEKAISLFLKCGGDLNRIFLMYELVSRESTITCPKKIPKTRPMEQYDGIPDGSGALFETNSTRLIWDFLREWSDNEAERSAIASTLGLEKTKGHYKTLLYFHAGIAYAPNENESQALKNIRLGLPVSGKDHGSRDTKDLALANLLEEWKGKEVDDVHQWLSERGYAVLLPEDDDIAGISWSTSFQEMAEIYWRLNEKYAAGGKKKQG